MLRFQLPLLLTALCAAGCDAANATSAVVDNDYAVVPDGGDAGAPVTEMTVFKVWWSTSLLPDAVAPGSEGTPERTVPNTDFAYAVLAPGWDPSSAAPPARFLAVKSIAKLSAVRGDVLHVHVSDATFAGNCAAGKPLSQSDADLVTKRIFPAEFATVTYDASNCIATPIPADGGDDAGAD
jgi:hypothetical protein